MQRCKTAKIKILTAAKTSDIAITDINKNSRVAVVTGDSQKQDSAAPSAEWRCRDTAGEAEKVWGMERDLGVFCRKNGC